MGSKILVVGCGGLGCELVKLLSMDETNELTLVDDDTIDATNLNRQFFFVNIDVSKSKCQVVGEKIKKKNNQLKVDCIFGRIDTHKKLEFYKSFDVVFNCLDNDAARSFVNQRCLLANVQLIDGGSAGWLGQSFCNAEECFDCLPKQSEKIYPICSIRQKPKNFEHCLIWGKAVIEDKDKLLEELETLKDIHVDSETGDEENAVGRKLKISKEIELDSSTVEEDSESEDLDIIVEKELKANKSITLDKEDVKKCKTVKFEFDETQFIAEINKIEDEVELIYKLASLKANVFGINTFSFIEAQTFLKKIIPSICTTNSIIASLMVITQKTRKNYYLVQGSQGIIKVDLSKKRNDCFVCSLPTYKANVTSGTTISQFLQKFNGESLMHNSQIFANVSIEKLDKFDGDILLCMRNGQPNRIYFEIGNEEIIKRIR